MESDPWLAFFVLFSVHRTRKQRKAKVAESEIISGADLLAFKDETKREKKGSSASKVRRDETEMKENALKRTKSDRGGNSASGVDAIGQGLLVNVPLWGVFIPRLHSFFCALSK